MWAIVQAGDQDQLGVDLNPHPGQTTELLHHVRSARVVQDAAAQVGIGGVDGDVEGAQVLLLYPCPVLLRQVGQGDVVAEEEGVPVVVVLDVEGGAQPPGHLGDKAELAAVVAPADVGVKGGTGELQAQGLIVPAAGPQGLLLSLPADDQGQTVFGAVELDVYDVPQGMSVDGDQFVAGAQAQPRSKAIGMDGGDRGGRHGAC